MNLPALRISAWLISILIIPRLYLCGQSGPDLALTGARIYPSPTAPPIEDGTVLIRNGRIAAVGSRREIRVSASDSIIDCKGLTLTAAFWNCHVHFIEDKWRGADLMPADQFNHQMEQMLTSHGFAHVYDIAEFSIENVLLIRNRIKGGDVRGPVIYTTGVPLVPPQGSPFYIAPLKLPEVSDAKQAAIHILQQVDSGANAVKIWTGSPVAHKIIYMPADIVRHITATAHRLGKPVFAHPTDTKGMMIAVNNGVDVLAHTSPDDGRFWSADTIRKMLAAHVALIPTLKLWKDELIKAGVANWAQNSLVLTAQRQLHDFEKAGGPVLFGTDVGYLPDYATVDEYLLLTAAGIPFPRILAMLTTTPAQRFGLGKRTGRVAAGMDADIVLLKGDPATGIQALDNVTCTILRGRVIYRSPDLNSR